MNNIAVLSTEQLLVDWAADGKSLDEIYDLAQKDEGLQRLTKDGIVAILSSKDQEINRARVGAVVADPQSFGSPAKRVEALAELADGLDELLRVIRERVSKEAKEGKVKSYTALTYIGGLYLKVIAALKNELGPIDIEIEKVNKLINDLRGKSPDEQSAIITRLKIKKSGVSDSELSRLAELAKKDNGEPGL